jgi:hypothetical protein
MPATSFAIDIKHGARTCTLDLREVFERIDVNGKSIEARLKVYPGVIGNEAFFLLKKILVDAFPVAINMGRELMRSTPSYEKFAGSDYYFNYEGTDIDSYEICPQTGAPEFTAHLLFDLHDVKSWPVYLYDTRGMIALVVNARGGEVQYEMKFMENID